MQLHSVPIFDDNYVFLGQNSDNEALIVDPGDARPVLDFIQSKKLHLTSILLTHHHPDHCGGVREISQQLPGLKIFGPLISQQRIPQITNPLGGSEVIQALGQDWQILSVPGHTLDHIAYFNREHGVLFSGDVLFGMGCGRLFEGSPQQGFASLQKIKSLPDETLVYCTHEYTQTNMGFVEKLIEDKKFPGGYDSSLWNDYTQTVLRKREQGQATVPLQLGIEKKLNPFLCSRNADEFAQLRLQRNVYK